MQVDWSDYLKMVIEMQRQFQKSKWWFTLSLALKEMFLRGKMALVQIFQITL